MFSRFVLSALVSTHRSVNAKYLYSVSILDATHFAHTKISLFTNSWGETRFQICFRSLRHHVSQVKCNCEAISEFGFSDRFLRFLDKNTEFQFVVPVSLFFIKGLDVMTTISCFFSECFYLCIHLAS